jgi:hypothetical protein
MAVNQSNAQVFGGIAVENQVYEIRIQGHLGSSWSSWFEGLEISRTADGATILTGPLPDQAALHGVLMKIRDLGLALISVNCKDGEG